MMSIAPCHDRASVRRSVSVPCQVVAEEGFRLVGVELLDVSARGALVRSRGIVELGEPVLLSLRVPNTRHFVDAEGRVTRIVRGARGTDRGSAFGVSLERIDAMDHALLVSAIEMLPETTPARAIRLDYAHAVRIAALV